MINSRMKDYFDLLALAREGATNPANLSRAIAATFQRRKTPLPEAMPAGLTPQFASDALKLSQWNSFLKRNRLAAPDLGATIEELAEFLRHPLAAARGAQKGQKKA